MFIKLLSSLRLLLQRQRTIGRFCSVPHRFKCQWQTWEQADFLKVAVCFIQKCVFPPALCDWLHCLLLLRRCTVWRSWASRWRRWILTEEPSLWVTLWAAPELDRWWRCSTSSDAEGRGSSRLLHTHTHGLLATTRLTVPLSCFPGCRAYGVVSMCIGTGMGAAAVFEYPRP